MDRRAAGALLELDNLVRLLGDGGEVEAEVEWSLVEGALDRLTREARRHRLPAGLIRENLLAVRHSLGVLLGKEADDGHSRGQHVAWALGALQRLRVGDLGAST